MMGEDKTDDSAEATSIVSGRRVEYLSLCLDFA